MLTREQERTALLSKFRKLVEKNYIIDDSYGLCRHVYTEADNGNLTMNEADYL